MLNIGETFYMNKDLYDPYKIMISGYLILIWHYSPFILCVLIQHILLK